MDSPIRTTPEAKKHNKRMMTRGGVEREVWDELNKEGVIVKTAVWDITNRFGEPLGEQSWDELEAYIEAKLAKKREEERERSYRLSPEFKDQRKAAAEARKRKREEGKREVIAEIMDELLGDDPEPVPLMPGYRWIEWIAEKLGSEKAMKAVKISAIMQGHDLFFKDMGFTFSTGYSAATRNECTYIGYMSEERKDDIAKRASRDAAIREKIPSGMYTAAEVIGILGYEVDEAKLRRNYYKWGLERTTDGGYTK